MKIKIINQERATNLSEWLQRFIERGAGEWKLVVIPAPMAMVGGVGLLSGMDSL